MKRAIWVFLLVIIWVNVWGTGDITTESLLKAHNDAQAVKYRGQAIDAMMQTIILVGVAPLFILGSVEGDEPIEIPQEVNPEIYRMQYRNETKIKKMQSVYTGWGIGTLLMFAGAAAYIATQ